MTEATAGAGSIVARGVIAREPGAPGVVEEFTIDAPGPGEALVRILASGVCHTDLSAKNGVFGTEGFPFLLGHEGAAVVEQVGEGVTNVAPGDHVILAWRAPCGADESDRMRRDDGCRRGPLYRRGETGDLGGDLRLRRRRELGDHGLPP